MQSLKGCTCWLVGRVIGCLLVGALAAFLLRYGLVGPGASLQQKSVPLQTHANMLMVRCAFYPETPPEIKELELLEEGRVTLISVEGDYAIELLDQEGQVRYRQAFKVVFVEMTDPPSLLDQVERVFVLPYSPEVRTVRLVTPQGQIEAPIP